MGIHQGNARQNSKYRRHLAVCFDVETGERSGPRQGFAAGQAAALAVAAVRAVVTDGQGWFLVPPPPRR